MSAANGENLHCLVGRAVDLLKSLDEIDCGDYSRECERCGGAGTVDCVQDGMPGQDWCPICGGTGITWDADQQRREKLEIIAAMMDTPNVPVTRSDDLLAAAFDLVSAARRVRSRYGTDDNGNPLDWTEWRDVDDACNDIDRIAANAGGEAR